MKTLLFTCAETCLLDSRYNNLSVINIIEEFNSAGFPVFIQKFAVAAMLERSIDESETPTATLRVELEGTPLFEQPLPVNFQDRLKVRTLAELQGFVIPNPGQLTFILLIGGDIAAEWRVRANHIGQAGVTAIVGQSVP